MPNGDIKKPKKPKESEAETFSAHQHLPHFPPPPIQTPGEDTFFYMAETADSPDREFEDIMLRRVPAAVAHQFRGAAGARGLTHAQYLAALVALHEAMRRRADAGNGELAAALDELGLRTVSI